MDFLIYHNSTLLHFSLLGTVKTPVVIEIRVESDSVSYRMDIIPFLSGTSILAIGSQALANSFSKSHIRAADVCFHGAHHFPGGHFPQGGCFCRNSSFLHGRYFLHDRFLLHGRQTLPDRKFLHGKHFASRQTSDAHESAPSFDEKLIN